MRRKYDTAIRPIIMPIPRYISCIVITCTVLIGGCMAPLPKNVTEPVYPFKTDGCSASPDFNFVQCCVEHDKAYWRGGSCSERRAADRALKRCIADNDHATLSKVYHASVRFFGSPLWPTPWRWGFGWPYGMTYTDAEDCDDKENALTTQK